MSTEHVYRAIRFVLRLTIPLAFCFGLFAASAQPVPRVTYTVDIFDPDPSVDMPDTAPDDFICDVGGGRCSLRAALETANARPGPDEIIFATGGTITISSDLEPLDGGVTLDGWSAGGTGYEGPPLVQLNDAAGTDHGLVLEGDFNVLRGLAITGFNARGLWIRSSQNEVYGNYIGLNLAGAADGNATGIELDALSGNLLTQNVIGGEDPPQRNVISGNTGAGILVNKATADPDTPGWDFSSGNEIIGNYIGTSVDGDAPLGNGNGGIVLSSDPKTFVSIGRGAAPNIISGNAGNGISIMGDSVQAIRIRGNIIGMNALNSAPLPNTQDGIAIQGGQVMQIANNTIAGNLAHGVRLNGAARIVLCGNTIGGPAAGNGEHGILIENGAQQNFVGFAPQVDAAAPPECVDGNIITANGLNAVRLPDAATRLNAIRGNSITGSIDLDTAGQNVNDPGDADSGANDILNTPALTNVVTTSTQFSAQVTLMHQSGLVPDTDVFEVHLYGVPGGCVPGSATLYLGAAQARVDVGGSTTFQVSLPGALNAGDGLTATSSARDPLFAGTFIDTPWRSTSEFSPCQTAALGADVFIEKTGTPQNVIVNQPITYTLTVTNDGPADSTNVVVTDTLPAGVTFVSASPGCAVAGSLVTCDLGIVAAGTSASITLVVNAPSAAGTITNTALVQADFDLDFSDNLVTLDTNVRTATRTPRPPTATDTALPPTITPTRTATALPPNPTDTPTPLPTPTDSPTPPPTATPTHSPSPSPVPSATPSPVPSATPSPLPSATPSPVPSNTAAPIPTSTAVRTAVPTAILTASPAQTATATGALPTLVPPIEIIRTIDESDDGTITISITINNESADGLSDAVLVEQFLSEVTLVESDPVCRKTEATITCNLGLLAGGASRQIELVLESLGVDPVLSRSTVRSANLPDITFDQPYIVKYAAPAFVAAGSEVTWTIQLLNPGTSPATGIRITDRIPDGLEILTARASRGIVRTAGNQITYQLAALGALDAVTLMVITRVGADYLGEPVIANNACLQTTQQRREQCVQAAVFRVDRLPSTGEPVWGGLRWGLAAGAILLAAAALKAARKRRP